ncbi:MAG TPA: nicotinate phosphoribosyltransferase [Acidimicrobiales bacterium]|nr:nicotinate phosphoribosyltransferase [Acidimicrobiales bacterium]
MPGGLLTDLYELNMAASYIRRHMAGPATFSLFVRRLPPTRGFLVAAGIEDSLRWLEGFGFEEADLDYLVGLGFDRRSVDAFAGMRFDGDVRAVPEGRIITANEPILEVSGPIATAQLVETYLLNQISFQTTLATKAARCRIAAAGRMDLVDFGFRRTHGIEAGLAAARLSALVGFSATSNVEAAHRFGLVPAGTMAHSYVEAFPSELEAFTAFAEDLPQRTTFLVDTYDNRRGVLHAIEVIRRLHLERNSGIRLDSGDLAELAFEARSLLDEAGLPGVRIFVSGSLDERDLARLVAAGAPVDAAGVGTRMGVSADAPYLDSAYKLVAYGEHPVAKLSTAKATLPGAKQVFRGPGLDDRIGLRDEQLPAGTTPLLEPVMREGKRLDAPGSWRAGRERFEADLAELPDRARDLDRPQPLVAGLTPSLQELTARVVGALEAGRRP